jgi:hypothetical protein
MKVWIRGLAPWGKETCTRAALAAAQLVDPIWRERGRSDATSALASVQQWIDCPNETHRRAAKQAATTVWAGPFNPRAAASACMAASRMERDPVKAAERAARDAGKAAWCALQTLRAHDDPKVIGSRLATISHWDVGDAIQAALVPWALGQDLGAVGWPPLARRRSIVVSGYAPLGPRRGSLDNAGRAQLAFRPNSRVSNTCFQWLSRSTTSSFVAFGSQTSRTEIMK